MALLWNPESWAQRLAELEAQSGELKEAPLRRDVRSLGMLLGEAFPIHFNWLKLGEADPE